MAVEASPMAAQASPINSCSMVLVYNLAGLVWLARGLAGFVDHAYKIVRMYISLQV